MTGNRILYVNFLNKITSAKKVFPWLHVSLEFGVYSEHMNAAATSGRGLHTCSGVQLQSETTASAWALALSRTLSHPSAIFTDDQRALKTVCKFLKEIDKPSVWMGTVQIPCCRSNGPVNCLGYLIMTSDTFHILLC